MRGKRGMQNKWLRSEDAPESPYTNAFPLSLLKSTANQCPYAVCMGRLQKLRVFWQIETAPTLTRDLNGWRKC